MSHWVYVILSHKLYYTCASQCTTDIHSSHDLCCHLVHLLFIIFLFIYGTGVQQSPLLLRPFIGLLYRPWMIDCERCGAVSGMNEWLAKPKYSKRLPSAAMSTTNPTWYRTRAAAAGSRRLTAWATARPKYMVKLKLFLQQAAVADRVVRRRGFHSYWTLDRDDGQSPAAHTDR
jgi:hypothetical protein